jgi:long-subunit fatty acid transport protein
MCKGAVSVIITFIFLSINLSDNVWGGALENNAIGIKATAMACSFTGVADDASAVHHNPASLAFNEKEIWYGETYLLSGISKTKYTEGAMTDKNDTNFYIPGFFIAKTYEKWAFGVGYYTSFAGGGVEYEDFQNSGYDLEAYLGLAPLTLAAAYKITPKLSLGVTFSIYTGYMGSKSLKETLPDNYEEVETEYSGFAGYGCSMGIMYKPSKTFSVGLLVRSAIDTKIDGESKIAGIKYDSDVDFTIPYTVSIGFGYKPYPDLTFSLAYFHVPWKELDKIDITTEGITQSNVTNFADGKLIGLGVEYILNSDFKLWGGLSYGACATKNIGISPVAPDSNKVQPSIGVGWNITQSLELSMSVVLSFGYDTEKSGIRELSHDSYMLMTGVRFKF